MIQPDSPPVSGLPADFRFGVSTSALQIEGALTADGRGPSIWDAFTPGAERACEHHARSAEDLDLAARLGIDLYRFSIAWPRVQPDGTAINARGLDFYDRLVDGVLHRGLTPFACLFHWDLPLALYERGGFAERATAERFAEYAFAVAERLGDRVPLWATLNEPFSHLSRGYIIGDHAPGEHRLDWGAVAHGLLLAHGRAVEALRAARVEGEIGLIESLAPVRALSDAPGDVGMAGMFDAVRNRLFLTPVLEGRIEEMAQAVMPSLAAAVRDGDLALISQPLDFVGINYYQPVGIRAAAPGGPVPFAFGPIDGLPRTAAGFMIDPDGLRESLVALKARHGSALPPVYVTEIGCACAEARGDDGRWEDGERVAYLAAHLRALAAALAEGVDVRGCLVWSLLDNFEWERGLAVRYGLVRVDFDTQERWPKRSYDWYAGLISGHRAAVGA